MVDSVFAAFAPETAKEPAERLLVRLLDMPRLRRELLGGFHVAEDGVCPERKRALERIEDVQDQDLVAFVVEVFERCEDGIRVIEEIAKSTTSPRRLMRSAIS